MSNIIDSIQLSGTVYTLSAQTGGGGVPESAFTAYTAATDERISQDEEVTAAALNELNESLSGKQDTLSAGTNITISGNVISAEGGGKAIEAGRGISITTGATADTVSFNIPIYSGTGINSLVLNHSGNTASGYGSNAEGYSTSATSYYAHAEGNESKASANSSHAEGKHTTASGSYSHAEGGWTTASGSDSHAEGNSTTANGYHSHAEGWGTTANNTSEHASGQYNVSSSASTTFGDSGNTLFSVGNGTYGNNHNAFEIRQNGDIYLSSGGTDIKLQDHLGGGGTVDQTIISGSTNAVAGGAVYNKIDEVEEVTAAGLNALNDKITPTVELTQAQYDALTVKDPNTYYIITDAQAGDLTQYWTSAQTQSAINQATSGKTNQSDFTGHTANTNVHLTTTEKTNIDSLATNISAISGITASKKSNWDTAYSRSVDNAVSYIQNTSDYMSFINKIWAGTQSQYDQLAYKDNYTLYIIKDNN